MDDEPGSGVHRYVLLCYRQPRFQQVEPPAKRANFQAGGSGGGGRRGLAGGRESKEGGGLVLCWCVKMGDVGLEQVAVEGQMGLLGWLRPKTSQSCPAPTQPEAPTATPAATPT